MADLAREADVPIYLSGLGTVQAFNSVLVKSRLDGQILKIDFAEGQEVRAGDIIAKSIRVPMQRRSRKRRRLSSGTGRNSRTRSSTSGGSGRWLRKSDRPPAD